MRRNDYQHLPEDLMIDILLRLPVKSLLKSNWYAIIGSPEFISKHFNHHNNHTRLLIHRHYIGTKNCGFALIPDETLAGARPVYQHLEYLRIPTILRALGPINGIILLYNYSLCIDFRMPMWNPSTRELRTLSVLYSNLPPRFTVFRHNIGFGLDHLTNDYKLFSIRRFWDSSIYMQYHSLVIAVYTPGTDSWRRIDHDLNSEREICGSASVVHVNGAYYWLSSDNVNNYTILVFDMGTEVFREAEAPNNPEGKFGNLVLHNDSIALLLFGIPGSDSEDMDNPNMDENFMDIWVMKQEGCWTKLLTVGPLLQVEQSLGFWKNGEIFVKTSYSQLGLYGCTNPIRHLGIEGIDVFNYKESLFSVRGRNLTREQENFSRYLQDFFIDQP